MRPVSAATASDARAVTGARPGQLIQHWRAERRKSQMALAHEADVSPRHLSFVETGRSNPSSAALSRIAAALDLSLRDHNTLMLAAGFAPPHPSSPWTGLELESIHRSLTEIVQAHAPFPAMVIDIRGDVLLANRPLLALIGDLPDEQQPLNTYRLVLQPGRFADQIVNRDAWQAHLAARLIERAADTGDPMLVEMAEATTRSTIADLDDNGPPTTPVLPLILRRPEGILNLSSIRAYLTEPRDVTASELSLETFIPLNDRTRAILEQINDRAGEQIQCPKGV